MINTYWKPGRDNLPTCIVTCEDVAGATVFGPEYEFKPLFHMGSVFPAWGNDGLDLSAGAWLSVCYLCDDYKHRAGGNGNAHFVSLVSHVQAFHLDWIRQMRRHQDDVRELRTRRTDDVKPVKPTSKPAARYLNDDKPPAPVGPVSSLTCTRCRQDVDYVRATDGVCEPCVAAELTHRGVLLARDVLGFVAGGDL